MYYYYLLYTKVHNLFVAYIHGNYACSYLVKSQSTACTWLWLSCWCDN